MDHIRRRQFVHYTQQRDGKNQRILSQGSCNKISRTITTTFILFIFLSHLIFPANSTKFNVNEETKKLRFIRDHLNKINKPAVKTILSPDGDIIDCVLSHKQPAFDHPKLKGQKPLDPPEMPKEKTGLNNNNISYENLQLWSMSDGYCPDDTVPIRRTSEDDLLRMRDYRRFGMKMFNSSYASSGNLGHEYALGSIKGGEYYGAKASINVWAPKVENGQEFSLAQMWVLAGSFGTDLNTIEAGWMVSPQLFRDNSPRLFTYWTRDAYQKTGCYNLICSGFVQTNKNYAVGVRMAPISSYNGDQYGITLLIFKDPKSGNWWLAFGDGNLIGYWPSVLFTYLKDHASMVQYGGEIMNTASSGAHTSTQMGSGHFAEESHGKAAYFRNLKTVDSSNSLIPLLSGLQFFADHPKCYDIKGGVNTDKDWGSYFYYGGPGKNSNCP